MMSRCGPVLVCPLLDILSNLSSELNNDREYTSPRNGRAHAPVAPPPPYPPMEGPSIPTGIQAYMLNLVHDKYGNICIAK